MHREEGFVVGSGNVFADLGFDEPEIELAKADLIHKISRIIADRRWTKRQAAQALEVDVPTLSALLRGRMSDFSLDRLFRFLNALDHDVTITVSPKPAALRRTRTTATEQVAAGAPVGKGLEGS